MTHPILIALSIVIVIAVESCAASGPRVESSPLSVSPLSMPQMAPAMSSIVAPESPVQLFLPAVGKP
jgi:hypothetical protein